MGREATIWAGTVVWLALALGGFWLWERHDATPGATGTPAAAADEPLGDRWRLTVFVHPRCPCGRASFEEAAELMRAAPELSVRVLFVCPPGAPDGWERGAGWDAATRLAGAEVARDADGAQARRFGAETSGFAVLADPNGRVVFRGGLTPARGRTGEGRGRRAVLAWLSSGSGEGTAPVFGCSLFDPDE
ncbi:MAG: hypothetical protein J0I06_26975 [Planctomycetes bacterium]|nr:hypothetical protein [Planctomycetota bacterium]